MRGELGDRVTIQHVLDAISERESYLDGVRYEAFVRNSERRFASIKQVEIIGAASNAVSQTIKDANQDNPWKEIKGFRNISIHEYFGVNLRIVWDIVQHDLPPMKEKLNALLNT